MGSTGPTEAETRLQAALKTTTTGQVVISREDAESVLRVLSSSRELIGKLTDKHIAMVTAVRDLAVVAGFKEVNRYPIGT